MKRLFFLTLGMFTVGSSSFMIAGLLPEIGQSIGQPISITGQGITAFSLTYLISAPLCSLILANKSPKSILQAALTVFIVGNFLTLICENIFVFLLGRVLTGLGSGMFNPLCVSIAIQLGGQAAKGKVLSLVWGANSAGAVFGVPFGVYLASELSWQWSMGFLCLLGGITLVGLSLQRALVGRPEVSSWGERLPLLLDKNVLAVIGVTCFTSIAALGLYSYVAPIQQGAPHSLSVSLFFWGLGGFLGSSVVGFFVDRTQNPRAVMVCLLMGLAITLFSLPFTKDIPYIGLLSFFMWGAFGWATPTPQQHILFGLFERQGAILSALNSSAFGLGSSMGTAMGGILIAYGLREIELPFFAATLLMGVVVGQLILIKKIPAKECYS